MENLSVSFLMEAEDLHQMEVEEDLHQAEADEDLHQAEEDEDLHQEEEEEEGDLGHHPQEVLLVQAAVVVAVVLVTM